MKIIFNGELKDFRINKEMAIIRFTIPMSDIANYIQIVSTINKSIEVLIKTGETKMCISKECISKKLNIDLKGGDAVYELESDIDELDMTLDDIKTIKGKVCRICIVEKT